MNNINLPGPMSRVASFAALILLFLSSSLFAADDIPYLEAPLIETGETNTFSVRAFAAPPVAPDAINSLAPP